MNRELQLTDIEGYLPFGLEVINDQMSSPSKIIEANFSTGYVKLEGWANEKHIRHFKPLLRSMRDSHRPMTHPDINDGKPFTPLFEMCRAQHKFRFPESYVREMKFNLKLDHTFRFQVQYSLRDIADVDDHEYIYAITSFLCDAEIHLLQKLHFDYKNLIDLGLATQNPN